jgi:hypothetical protein
MCLVNYLVDVGFIYSKKAVTVPEGCGLAGLIYLGSSWTPIGDTGLSIVLLRWVPIGEGSSCGADVSSIEGLGGKRAIIRVHSLWTLHLCWAGGSSIVGGTCKVL